ncbi:hypothetical protein ACTGJ9_025660 [Bradyrhizobium sp. RDM12]
MNYTMILASCIAILLGPKIAVAYPVQGLGATSCAEFAKMYQSDPKNMELYFFTWAQGYMSGLNMGLLANKQEAKELGAETNDQALALRTYCADNPLKTYMDAVLNLWKTLRPFNQNTKGAK